MLETGKASVKDKLAAFKQSNSFLQKAEEFFESRWFLLTLACYIFITQAFGLDLIGFIGLALAFIFICLFCDDTNVAVPILCMAVFCVSTQNSPWGTASGYEVTGKCTFTVGEASTYYSSLPFIVTAIVGGTLVLAAAAFRVVVYGDFRRSFSKNGLLIGVAALSASFLLSGIFSRSWQWIDFSFAGIQAATFFLVYLFFASTLNFEKFTLSKIADIMLTVMFYIMALLIYIYATRFYGFLILSGGWKAYMVCGWGMSNDFGTYLAITMPACFYRITRTPKHKWIWIAALVLASVGIFFTLCRAAMVLAGVVLAIGMFVGIRDKEMRFRVILTIFWVMIGVGALMILLGATNSFEFFFDFFIKKGEGDVTSGRLNIWGDFWKYFLRNPVFGGGFAVNLSPDLSNGNGVFRIYSALAHNIFFQTLGSSGVVGLALGCFHLFTIGRILTKKFEFNRIFLAFAVISFLGISLLDTVFYKAQFTFLYLAILVSAEADVSRKERARMLAQRRTFMVANDYKPRVVFPFVEAGMGHIMPEHSIADAFEKKYGAYCEIVRSQFYSETNEEPLIRLERNMCNEVKKYNKNHLYGYLNMFMMDVFGPKILSKVIMDVYISGAGKAARKHMEELKPDLVLSTHWSTVYYAQQIADKPINVSYVPDVQIIPLCRYPNDMTLVSTSRGYNDALKKYKKRFNKDNLRVVPFAIRKQAFEVDLDKKAARRVLGLDENKLTIVLFEGGYGLGRMKQIVELIAKTEMKMNVVAICGKNEKLYEHLKNVKIESENVTLIVEGFCEKTLEYLAAADVWLGKSGASSIAEATFFGCASIVTKYATTMERDNAEYYLKDVKNCLKIFNAEKVVEKLNEWLENPKELRALQENAWKVHDLYGSEKTADVLWELLCEKFPHLKEIEIKA